ncbi:MAG: cysteine methyltransferase [Thiothrix lacustris]|uniref:Methylated-DNA--protein-cysteine methyltransferase n=1 Tax=Thiothrix lacustris TaxID=525917 RepID=A0A1Y1QAE7_9GAMM|nr:MAG: cysteine methyltransferase [Thiothrix lacustris]
MSIGFETWESPIGTLIIAANAEAVCAVAFESNWPRIRATLGNVQAQSDALTRAAISQLQAYFAGTRRTFDLPLSVRGTDFQQRTWQVLREIPYGETRSYSEQAAAIGQPQAVRAIGHTNGLNPISIIVPCHRVIAKSGKLAGYAGGLAAKQYLLALEANA